MKLTDIGYFVGFHGLVNGSFQWIWISDKCLLNINQLLVQRYTVHVYYTRAVLLNYISTEITVRIVKIRWDFSQKYYSPHCCVNFQHGNRRLSGTKPILHHYSCAKYKTYNTGNHNEYLLNSCK